MTKYILCDYYKNKNCKFMAQPNLCDYAHGEDDIKIIDCKYGNKCLNSKCLFYHGDINVVNKNIYEIPIIVKEKKKKVIKKNILPNVEVTSQLYIPDGVDKKPSKNEKNIVKIINKEKAIQDIVSIPNGHNIPIMVDFNSMECNKLLTFLDNYYINKYEDLNYKYNNIFKENNKLRKEIIFYKEKNINKSLDDDFNINIHKIKPTEHVEPNNPSMVDEILNYDKINLLNLYKKYNEIYKIFQECNFNYKIIDKNKLQTFTNDKNIYKLKKRAEMVFLYFNKYKSGMSELIPVSKIFKLKMV